MSVTVRKLQKAVSANSTSTGFTQKVTATTKPSGSRILDMLNISESIEYEIPKLMQIVPFGVGADTTTFSLRVIGWSQTTDSTPVAAVWVPQLLIEVACTLSTPTGTHLTDGVSNVFADTISITVGDTSAPLLSPANNEVASFLLHLRGSELIEFDFDMTGATSGNALWRMMDQ